MRGKDLLDKMELIDPAYIEAADIYLKVKKYSSIKKWAAVSACLGEIDFLGKSPVRLDF